MAPGWWLILVLAIIGLGLIGRWFWRRYRRAHYRRIALSQLRLLRANEATITDINQLLKAAALRAFPPEQVAALHGQRWQAFLLKTCKICLLTGWQSSTRSMRRTPVPLQNRCW